MKQRTTTALLLGTLLLFPFLLQAAGNPDTTFSFLLRLKMAKAVSQGTFNPDTGRVYAVSEPGFGTVQLAAGGNYIYEGIVAQGLDSAQTYTFRFRINDTLYETVTRNITANPGTTEYSAWWNDDPINVTTFNVDMTYMVLVNAFDPAVDSVDITGTMNGWGGSPLMGRVDTSYVYTLAMPLDPGIVYKYKYRVNRDTATTEFLNGNPRYFRAPDTLITLNQFFYDYNPATVPMTFLCDMRYQQEAGNFDTVTDYVDVAGNFNNGGAWDLLYLLDGDSIHRATLFFDTTMIGGAPLSFKFRINGDPAKEELTGQPPRSYTLHTPSLSDPNRYYCWFDDTNPNIPAPPWVTDLFIQGTLISGSTVTGSYAYHNLNGIPEGNSLYKWYKTDTIGGVLVPIDSAWQVNYTIDSTLDVGQYLVFEVIPVAASGDSAIGQPVQVYSDWAVGGLGIGEKERLNVRFYPNPVGDELRIESQEKKFNLVISDMKGGMIMSRSFEGAGRYNISVEHLSPGTYLLHFYCPDKGFYSGKVIKQ
jgi:hypothetical protein